MTIKDFNSLEELIDFLMEGTSPVKLDEEEENLKIFSFFAKDLLETTEAVAKLAETPTVIKIARAFAEISTKNDMLMLGSYLVDMMRHNPILFKRIQLSMLRMGFCDCMIEKIYPEMKEERESKEKLMAMKTNAYKN